jgi:tetratricopeptide (TPR) repeat protein
MKINSIVPFFLLYFMIVFLTACQPSVKELSDKSRMYMSQGNFGAAITVLDQLIVQDPQNQSAYNMRGIAKLEMGNANEAIVDFTTSVNLDNSNYKAYYNRGNAFYRNGEYENAVEDYDLALRLEPKEADIYINRGNALVQQEKFEEAVRDYMFALKLDDTNYLTHFNLARAYYLLDELQSAKISFEKSTELYTAYAPNYYFLGMIALEQNDLDGSCALLKRASDLGYEQAKAVMELYCDKP